MNLVEAFRDWLDDQSVATSGQDLFISRAPTGADVPDSLWWLTASGGNREPNVNGGRRQNSTVSVYYRSTDPQQVYNKLEELDTLLDTCLDLDGYQVVSYDTTGPFTDQDLDNENRLVGLLEVRLVVYRT